jgi:predicted RND superfamily exporter protein
VEIGDGTDLAQLTSFVATVDSSISFTGIPVVNAVLATQFRRQFFLGLAAGTAMVFVLMLATFRRIDLTLIAILPTALGLLWAGALLATLGPSLDLFSIFAVLTLIGIGVDYSVHLVHRVASEPRRLDTALARVAPANLVAAVIAILGCGSLMTSSYPPLRTLGIATTVGLCTCLVASILVLHALLMAIPPPRFENERATSTASGAPLSR